MQHVIPEIKQGNVDTFRSLFEELYPVLCVFTSRYTRNREQCEDIAQEVLLLYWERRDRFDHLFQVKSFLFTSARNRALNLIKREKVNRDFLRARRVESDEFYEENLVEQETYLLVRQAIRDLPPRSRTVIELSMEGLTTPEIALAMSISGGTVHSLKKTAYRKLREQLRDLYLVFLFSI
ncbi:MAG: sigma-70 family RNA polymerase sigma factor [Odoribacteraceae bacterium]|jgi:RNA polymerase sigma-70 factor (ECF subfamily)|nr:sigma-70 family RNA polymerase sigma factor [Odoribacteraceae bacterium]